MTPEDGIGQADVEAAYADGAASTTASCGDCDAAALAERHAELVMKRVDTACATGATGSGPE